MRAVETPRQQGRAQVLDRQASSWPGHGRSVYLALSSVVKSLSKGTLPASVLIAHSYLVGRPFVRQGQWVVPQFNDLDEQPTRH
jgi:hypothetical protein